MFRESIELSYLRPENGESYARSCENFQTIQLVCTDLFNNLIIKLSIFINRWSESCLTLQVVTRFNSMAWYVATFAWLTLKEKQIFNKLLRSLRVSKKLIGRSSLLKFALSRQVSDCFPSVFMPLTASVTGGSKERMISFKFKTAHHDSFVKLAWRIVEILNFRINLVFFSNIQIRSESFLLENWIVFLKAQSANEKLILKSSGERAQVKLNFIPQQTKEAR